MEVAVEVAVECPGVEVVREARARLELAAGVALRARGELGRVVGVEVEVERPRAGGPGAWVVALRVVVGRKAPRVYGWRLALEAGAEVEVESC